MEPETPVIPPVPEPIPVQKSHTIFWIFIVILLLFVVAVSSFYIGTLQTLEYFPIPTPSPTSYNEVFLPPTIAPDEIPKENTVYLATSVGQQVIYFTNKEKQKVNESGVDKTSPYFGEMKVESGGGATGDYRQLSQPRRIYTPATKEIYSLGSFKLSPDNKIIYLGINYLPADRQYPDIVNTIVQVNLTDLSSKEIWSHNVGTTKYESAGGAAYLNQVVGTHFIALKIMNCYACEGSPVGTILINTNTKGELFLKDIGDIQVDETKNTFTYQKLAEFKEACEPDPGCDNGIRKVKKPSGDFITQNLP